MLAATCMARMLFGYRFLKGCSVKRIFLERSSSGLGISISLATTQAPVECSGPARNAHSTSPLTLTLSMDTLFPTCLEPLTPCAECHVNFIPLIRHT